MTIVQRGVRSCERERRMDTVTHGLITRLFARAALPPERRQGLVAWVAFCSMFPDVDIFYSGSDPLAVLQNHRGITHSFLGAALLSLPLAALAYGAPRLWRRRSRGRIGSTREAPVEFAPASSAPEGNPEGSPPSWRFRTLYLASVLGICSHIFFDLVTSYGTMILQPFSDRRFSLDLWFILDPYVWLILSLPWILRRFGAFRVPEEVWGDRLGALLLVGYLLLSVLVQVTALRRLETWAKEQGLSVVRIGAIPVAFSPLHRKGIILTPERVYDIPVRFARAEFGPIAVHPSPFRAEDPLIQRAWETPQGRRYRWFARFPLAERWNEGEKSRVILSDLRFQGRWEDLDAVGRTIARGLLRIWPHLLHQKRQALEVIFDAQGRIERITFVP